MLVLVVAGGGADVENRQQAAELRRERHRALVPRVRVRGYGSEDDLVELGRHARVGHAGSGCSAVRGTPRREHLEEDRAYRVDVRPLIRVLAARLFRRVVIVQLHVGGILAGVHEPAARSQLERRNLRVPLRGDHDGVGTEAAVDEPAGMRVGDSIRGLDGDL